MHSTHSNTQDPKSRKLWSKANKLELGLPSSTLVGIACEDLASIGSVGRCEGFAFFLSTGEWPLFCIDRFDSIQPSPHAYRMDGSTDGWSEMDTSGNHVRQQSSARGLLLSLCFACFVLDILCSTIFKMRNKLTREEGKERLGPRNFVCIAQDHNVCFCLNGWTRSKVSCFGFGEHCSHHAWIRLGSSSMDGWMD